jgi:hypothetical protein
LQAIVWNFYFLSGFIVTDAEISELKIAENSPAVKYDRDLDALIFFRGGEFVAPGAKFTASLEVSSNSCSLASDKVLHP